MLCAVFFIPGVGTTYNTARAASVLLRSRALFIAFNVFPVLGAPSKRPIEKLRVMAGFVDNVY
jgi:hypothetical protein